MEKFCSSLSFFAVKKAKEVEVNVFIQLKEKLQEFRSFRWEYWLKTWSMPFMSIDDTIISTSLDKARDVMVSNYSRIDSLVEQIENLTTAEDSFKNGDRTFFYNLCFLIDEAVSLGNSLNLIIEDLKVVCGKRKGLGKREGGYKMLMLFNRGFTFFHQYDTPKNKEIKIHSKTIKKQVKTILNEVSKQEKVHNEISKIVKFLSL